MNSENTQDTTGGRERRPDSRTAGMRSYRGAWLSHVVGYAARCWSASGCAVFALMVSLPVQANDLKSVFERWTANLKGAGPLLLIVFSVLGLVCVGVGLYKFTIAHKRQASIAEGLIYIVVGSLLLSLIAFSGVLSGTSFGSNEANMGLNALGVD